MWFSLCFSQTSSNLILNVDYFDRSAVSVASGLPCELKKNSSIFLDYLANIIIDDNDAVAVAMELIPDLVHSNVIRNFLYRD